MAGHATRDSGGIVARPENPEDALSVCNRRSGELLWIGFVSPCTNYNDLQSVKEDLFKSVETKTAAARVQALPRFALARKISDTNPPSCSRSVGCKSRVLDYFF